MSTVLLIPGLVCDSTVWQPYLSAVASVNAEANNGASSSSVAVADLTTQSSITQMAEDCLGKHHGMLRVAGHSMGARVAMEMTRLAPNRIERLVLLSTGIHALKPGELQQRTLAKSLSREQGMNALARQWLPGTVFRKNQRNSNLMAMLENMVVSCSSDIHARQIDALIQRPDASLYIGQFNCPVLLIVGRQDTWSPVSQHELMHELIPHSQLEIVEDAGHFVLLEQADIVTGLLSTFLR